jgi:hypothetical protein
MFIWGGLAIFFFESLFIGIGALPAVQQPFAAVTSLAHSLAHTLALVLLLSAVCVGSMTFCIIYTMHLLVHPRVSTAACFLACCCVASIPHCVSSSQIELHKAVEELVEGSQTYIDAVRKAKSVVRHAAFVDRRHTAGPGRAVVLRRPWIPRSCRTSRSIARASLLSPR